MPLVKSGFGIARRFGAILLLMGIVAGCAPEEPPPQSFPDIRFLGAEPIRFDAARVEVVSSFQPSFMEPDVEQHFPVPPQRALENWARDRLQAVNPTSPNIVRVTILDASVTENPSPPIPHEDTLYSARAELKVELLDDHGFAQRTASASATRTRTELADSFQNTIDSDWYLMTKELTKDVTGEAERQIQSSFYPFLQN